MTGGAFSLNYIHEDGNHLTFNIVFKTELRKCSQCPTMIEIFDDETSDRFKDDYVHECAWCSTAYEQLHVKEW